MAVYNSERQIGDDEDSLTEITEECLTHDTIRLRNTSYI